MEGPTDRELIVGLFNLVGALAKKLTGEAPLLRVSFGDGDYISVCPSGTGSVTWVKEEAEGWCDPERESCPKPDGLPALPDASPPGYLQAVGR